MQLPKNVTDEITHAINQLIDQCPRDIGHRYFINTVNQIEHDILKKHGLPTDHQVTTYDEDDNYRYFRTVSEAMEHAKKVETVWEIRFVYNNDALRLIRNGDDWVVRL